MDTKTEHKSFRASTEVKLLLEAIAVTEGKNLSETLEILIREGAEKRNITLGEGNG